jgi:molecular chaperone IbpA
MTITGAELKDGLLCIDIVREVPEAQKPRQIPINTKLAIEAPASKRAA